MRVLVCFGLLVSATAHAQLSAEATDRCVHAAVKIVMLADGRGGSTGSGSLIDPRGYVLTNFHVVGHVHPETGVPGTLHNAQNRVLMATVDSARQAARPRWRGVVVRGDARLDLALVRIVADSDGTPIEGAPFPTVPLAATDDLRPGSRVWAFGFPLGVRTINVTEGSIAGFQMNARDQVSWLRSDAEFNPGNSGGMLVDREGRLIGVPTRVFHGRGRALEPVELARPVERVPQAWLNDLRRGHIEDVQIRGAPAVREGGSLEDVAVGDHGTVGAPDQHFYRLEPRRSGTLRITPPLPVAIMRGNNVVREGQGEVEVQADDPDELIVSVLIPNAGEQAVSYEVALEARPVEVATEETGPATVEEPTPAPTQPATVVVRGVVANAISGQAVSNAWVLVAEPGVDLEAALRAFLSGEISETSFRRQLAATARSDVQGGYSLGPLLPGRYRAAALARGYRPSLLTLTTGTDPLVNIGPIELRP